MGDTTADCQALLEKLYVFVDAELGEEECAALQRHVDACAGCMGHVEFERAFKEFVKRRCGGDPIPEGLADRVRASVRARRGR
jgi:mycothiol system anti-sigma-R factor